MLQDDGRSISGKVVLLNILIHDMINLLYHEHWIGKQKYFLRIYYCNLLFLLSGENIQCVLFSVSYLKMTEQRVCLLPEN